MAKVKIYTYSHNRPDFISLQYESIKKHVKDDFEYIVFNNERPGGDGIIEMLSKHFDLLATFPFVDCQGGDALFKNKRIP